MHDSDYHTYLLKLAWVISLLNLKMHRAYRIPDIHRANNSFILGLCSVALKIISRHLACNFCMV